MIGCDSDSGTRTQQDTAPHALIGSGSGSAIVADAGTPADGGGGGSGSADASIPPDAPLNDAGCLAECTVSDLEIARADSNAEPEYFGPWDISDCETAPSNSCPGQIAVTCQPDTCALNAQPLMADPQPKADPSDLGDVKNDPKSVIGIINLGTVEIEGVIEYKKAATDKVKTIDFKVAAGKAALMSLEENAKNWAEVKVIVVKPKGQLYKQVEWVDKEFKWKTNGTAKSGTLPILPVYSKDP